MILLEQQQGNRTTIGGGEASFDTNMVIIHAALLCALICALGLNSIVRCTLRCSRGLEPESADRSTAARGLKKSALRRIPVAAYGPSAAAVGTNCAICLGEFDSDERVRVLPGFSVDLLSFESPRLQFTS
jgi:E3 ubiquitin-protein ligase ATL10/75/76/77/78